MTQGVPQRRLGDLFTFKNGRAFKKGEWSASGLPIIRIQNLNSTVAAYNFFDGQYSNDILVEKGDLLFSWSGTIGSSFGPHVWDREPGLLNQHIFKVGHGKEIEKRYALHALRFITAEIEKNVSGAVGLVHITKERLNEFLIPVPPIAEQQRIVALLDEALAGIATAKANAESALEQSRNVFQSKLDGVFDGGAWPMKPLSATSDVFADGDWIESKDQAASGIRLIQTGNVGAGVFKAREGKARYISEGTFDRLRCTEIFPGDCLVSRLPDPVGRSCLLPETGCRMITAVDCTIIRFKRLQVLPEFFVNYSTSNTYLRAIRAATTGTTRDRISRSNLGRVLMPVPTLPEQRQVVKDLAEVEAEVRQLESIYSRKLAALDELKQSLLNQAFSGQL